MENTNTIKNKYFNNINYVFFGLLILGAIFIFGWLRWDDLAQYKEQYKSNQKQISIISEEKNKSNTEYENVAAEFKRVTDEHNKKIADYDSKIKKLSDDNKALASLIGEDVHKLVPQASAETISWTVTPASSGVPPTEWEEVQRDLQTSLENQVEEPRMMDLFGLNGCRFTNSKHYIPRLNADWFGYDYACISWESFNIATPSNGWTVDIIWHDKNMWDYVFIKKGNFRVGFGHMTTSRKVGDKLNRYDIIGQSNISGASTGMHIHIELWDGDNNVSYEYMLGKPYQSKKVPQLLEDRGITFGGNIAKDTNSLHSRVCKLQPTSPLCTDKNLFDRLEKITKERTDYPYAFPILLGITNSESSLGINFAPQKCGVHNNWWGIKWKKDDNNKNIKDQPIPQADGCWLYHFDSVDDYWISKTNTFRYGYDGCFNDNPKKTLECMSRYYVGEKGSVKYSWVNNASIFLN